EMGAAAGAELDVVDQAAGPDAGGIDHRARPDLHHGSGELVSEHGPVAVDLEHPGPGADLGTEAGSGAGDGGDQAGVVLELAVPAEDAAADVRTEDRRQVAALG